MLEFLSSDLRNYVYFKEAHLDLNYHGVTVIKGSNMNSNPPSENGAGKSLLVSGPANCLMDSHPVITDRSSSMKKMLAPQGSRNVLRWINNNVEYKVVKINKKNKLLYRIFKDGEDQKARTPTIAKDILTKIFPFTEEEFYNQIYLDGRRTSIFQMGSFAGRLEFISSIYHVDIFDKLKISVSQKRKELSLYETQYSIKKADKQDLEKSLLSDRHSKIVAVKSLRIKVKKLKQIANKLQRKLAHARFQKSREEYLEKIKKLASALDIKVKGIQVSNIKNLLESANTLKTRYSHNIKQQEKYCQYLEDEAEYKQAKLSIEKLFASAGTAKQFSKQQVSKLLSKWKNINIRLETEISSVKETIKATDTRVVEKPSAQSTEQHKLQKKKYGHDLLVNMESARDILFATIETLVKTVESLEKHLKKGHVECEYCGSRLTQEGIQKTLKIKQQELQKQRETGEVLVEAISVETQYQEQRVRYLTYKEQLAQKEGLEIQLRALSNGYKKSLGKVNKFEKANKAYLEMSYLKKPESQKEISLKTDFENKVNMLDKLIGALNSYLPLATKGFTEIDYAQIQKKYDKVQEKLDTLQSKLPLLEAKLINDKDLRKRIANIERDMERWKEQLEDAELYDFLYMVLPKVKMLAIKNIAKEMETNLNNYSNLLFCEPVHFVINIEKGHFDIIVTRNPGRKEIVSDVKVLSGAEAKAFNLLVFLSILMNQPDSRRTNMVILDEFDANMGDNNRKLFINNFIPMLNTIIPHVIIVTPNHDEYPSARTFLVKKKGNEAQLLEGER